ncbi:MAG: flavin-containing monooxygenase [Solirubrobacterales bacterium]
MIVIGAGAGGLSTALALVSRGVDPLVIDRADGVGSSWRSRYDRLRLNSPRTMSHLVGHKFPKGTPMFPSRGEVIAHLEQAAAAGLESRLGNEVQRLESDDGYWRLQASGGELLAKQVVVATGYDHTPTIPDRPGRAQFDRPLLHSSEYRNADAFAGKKVLVVGSGSSGMEIAYDLAEHPVAGRSRRPARRLHRKGDDARAEPDAVVCATGYRRGLEPVVGHLGVLDERGVPRATGGKAPLPGLRFVGYTVYPAMLKQTRGEAVAAAQAIARELTEKRPAGA